MPTDARASEIAELADEILSSEGDPKIYEQELRRLTDVVRLHLIVERQEGRAEREAEVKECLNVIRELRQKLAIAGVEGSPPPIGETTIATLLRRARALRERVVGQGAVIEGAGERQALLDREMVALRVDVERKDGALGAAETSLKAVAMHSVQSSMAQDARLVLALVQAALAPAAPASEEEEKHD